MMALTCRCSNPTASAAFAEWDVAAATNPGFFHRDGPTPAHSDPLALAAATQSATVGSA